MYVPYLGGVRNQWTQLVYGPQVESNLGQPLLGKNPHNYQQYAGYHGQAKPTYGPTRIPMLYQYYNYPQPNMKLPFLATLDLSYLLKLINDPILHDPFWLTILVKLSLDIPNFDGK